MADVRKATIADLAAVSGGLASAFGSDPVVCWMSGQANSEKRMIPFWRALARVELNKPEHEIFLTEGGDGIAVWRGIDRWKLPAGDVMRSFPGMVRSLRVRTPMALKLLSTMEKAHPTAPHYYLEFLGTRRDKQGKGLGSELLTQMLDRCDTEGLPAYLESSNPRNVPFYARYGFKETGTIKAPGGGPSLTPMWREPRS